MPAMADSSDVSNYLRTVLNSHGFAFQQAVLRACIQLGETTGWKFVQSEFPFELHGREGHIDFLLANPDTNSLLVAECKRADPARANWCFARTTYTASRSSPTRTQRPVFSIVNVINPPTRLVETPSVWTRGEVHHLLFELRTGATGSGKGQERAAEAAVTQAFRGASGLIQYLDAAKETLPINTQRPILPVVFTTASLYATDVELADADLGTGDLAEVPVEPVPWAWYQVNLSSSHRPENVFLRGRAVEATLELSVLYRHTRAVCVVNVLSLPAFFEHLSGLGTFLEL
jgi:hypothetical protein